jgi:hypothetical protein
MDDANRRTTASRPSFQIPPRSRVLSRDDDAPLTQHVEREVPVRPTPQPDDKPVTERLSERGSLEPGRVEKDELGQLFDLQAADKLLERALASGPEALATTAPNNIRLTVNGKPDMRFKGPRRALGTKDVRDALMGPNAPQAFGFGDPEAVNLPKNAGGGVDRRFREGRLYEARHRDELDT